MLIPSTTYATISKINGPLVTITGVKNPTYGEIVNVLLPDGTKRTGKVLETLEDKAVVQIFEGTEKLDILNSKVELTGELMQIGVSKHMLGRVFDGQGRPIDNGPEIIPEMYLDVEGASINPCKRVYPKQMIQTGISCIDVMTSIARGQKIPLFSGSGLPHNEVAAQICRQAKLVDVDGRKAGSGDDNFAIVFAGMGLTHEAARFFQENFTQSGAIQRTILFLNTSNSPTIERIMTPRLALTTAEFLAFTHNYHILVILTDMTQYADAVRQISIQKQELPGRKSYPGYLYTDLASIYERAGRIDQNNWFLGIRNGNDVQQIGMINTNSFKVENIKVNMHHIYQLQKDGKIELKDTATDEDVKVEKITEFTDFEAFNKDPTQYKNLIIYSRKNENSGSITQIPILTLPNDDISHTIPDLTGYITEGQVFVSRKLSNMGLYPCLDPLPSLSRLMKSAIGEGMSRKDHQDVSNQLYYCYALAQEVQNIKQIVGEDALSADDKIYLAFLNEFETKFLKQGQFEDRSIQESLDIAWGILRMFPERLLQRIPNDIIEQFYRK
ncbi:Vacuolar ATP synthase subunit B [Spironucleus salmonicida]|uniref:Vacuolar ATP synthase subunit B n=1 Tax=Spironucleus salmonicida TaxID=348837 RepID=V6LQL3_9EUKA|nr:Vacuolar ATP synthase subunit B [Spironucleus salmonicida]|eukprot:EST46870.1 Vacuolar ATP synthase subunit B [Spironucleus salmonicida]